MLYQSDQFSNFLTALFFQSFHSHTAVKFGSTTPKSIICGNGDKTFIRKMATNPLEKLHLKFLKWALRVHKKCSNIACYGDSGRYPLAVSVKLPKQVVSYYNRLDNLNAANDPSLVRHVFFD